MRVRGAEKDQKAIACWAVWVATEIFPVTIEFLVMCRDMVLRMQAVAGS